MAKVILGYPGVGLIGWVKGRDEGTGVWSDKFDPVELADLNSDVVVYGAPLTEEALQLCADNKIGATLVYPAPVTLSEYSERQVNEGMSKDDSDALLALAPEQLRVVREDTSKRNQHMVLGRNEYAVDFFG